MEHWAQFAVLADISSFERPNWADELRWAVDMAKPARSWPLWGYFLALTAEARALAVAAGGWRKQIEVRYPRCTHRLNGLWLLGSGGGLHRVAGGALDGSWSLGGRAPVYAYEQLRQCDVYALIHARRTAARPARHLHCRVGESPAPRERLLARGA